MAPQGCSGQLGSLPPPPGALCRSNRGRLGQAEGRLRCPCLLSHGNAPGPSAHCLQSLSEKAGYYVSRSPSHWDTDGNPQGLGQSGSRHPSLRPLLLTTHSCLTYQGSSLLSLPTGSPDSETYVIPTLDTLQAPIRDCVAHGIHTA